MTILHEHLPYRPWSEPGLARLPGAQPTELWLYRDEVFDAQMALRDRLIVAERAQVLAEGGGAAAQELLDRVLAHLASEPGYEVRPGQVTRPDGMTVLVDPQAPFATLARLVQEDLLLLEKQGDEHVLVAGNLLFPASWSLPEKLGRPMVSIHLPVERYDADLARRVQRLLDLMRPAAPIWRANWLIYHDADLFQPRREADRRSSPGTGEGWLRSERQSLLKLPETGAVVFAIHTYVLPRSAVAEDPPPR